MLSYAVLLVLVGAASAQVQCPDASTILCQRNFRWPYSPLLSCNTFVGCFTPWGSSVQNLCCQTSCGGLSCVPGVSSTPEVTDQTEEIEVDPCETQVCEQGYTCVTTTNFLTGEKTGNCVLDTTPNEGACPPRANYGIWVNTIDQSAECGDCLADKMCGDTQKCCSEGAGCPVCRDPVTADAPCTGYTCLGGLTCEETSTTTVLGTVKGINCVGEDPCASESCDQGYVCESYMDLLGQPAARCVLDLTPNAGLCPPKANYNFYSSIVDTSTCGSCEADKTCGDTQKCCQEGNGAFNCRVCREPLDLAAPCTGYTCLGGWTCTEYVVNFFTGAKGIQCAP